MLRVVTPVLKAFKNVGVAKICNCACKRPDLFLRDRVL